MISFIYYRISVLFYSIYKLPLRIYRVILHLIPIANSSNKIAVKSFNDWILDLPFYILDLLAIPEIIEFLLLILNPSIRKLNFEQSVLLRELFEGCIYEDQVWVHSGAKIFTKKLAIAYVISNIVNYDQDIQDSTFIHELVHVCQFQKFGSVYISRALRAQIKKDPYNYGGSFGLAKAIAKGKHYLDFNFEQQAQIIEDYFTVKSRVDLRASESISSTYSYFYKQFREVYYLK